jgi:hypothetical protein
MGLGSWTGIYLVGPAMAIACKLAVNNGAWLTNVPVRRVAPDFAGSQSVSR